MFFLCVKIIKIKKINSIGDVLVVLTKFGSIDFSAVFLIKVTTKTVNDAKIEDKEEYLNINDTTNQVNVNKNPNP